ncbi:DUF2306 domain-containing protein [Hoeflea sp.]|uniref:DUF2306 domain-containing protein n=1 Tax=Hoeflea sp. TaxID=1940281 RepID=UPI003B522750
MTLEPLLGASFAIQFHVLTVVPAALIGGYVLWARKGTAIHRLLGRIWLVLMVLTALSSFFIHTIRIWGPFSPIHVLSIVVLISAFEVIRSARRRELVRHRRVVKSLYFGAIGVAGAFTLLPGRLMHETLFGRFPAGGAANALSSVGIEASVPVWIWPLLALLMVLGLVGWRRRSAGASRSLAQQD